MPALLHPFRTGTNPRGGRGDPAILEPPVRPTAMEDVSNRLVVIRQVVFSKAQREMCSEIKIVLVRNSRVARWSSASVSPARHAVRSSVMSEGCASEARRDCDPPRARHLPADSIQDRPLDSYRRVTAGSARPHARVEKRSRHTRENSDRYCANPVIPSVFLESSISTMNTLSGTSH